MRSAISSSSVRDLWGDHRGLLFISWLTLHLMLVFLSWSSRICCLSESLRILALSPSLPFCALVSVGVRWVFSTEVFQCDGASWQLHAGVVPACRIAMWIPSCYAWGAQAPVQPLRHQSKNLLEVTGRTSSPAWNLWKPFSYCSIEENSFRDLTCSLKFEPWYTVNCRL